MTAPKPLATHKPEQYVRISKVGAGYVYRKGTEYRCKDCWKYIKETGECGELAPDQHVKPNGYCILWSQGGNAQNFYTHGDYTPAEVGYGEKTNGTLCRRCEHFDGASKCELVEGVILPGACCDNQEPK